MQKSSYLIWLHNIPFIAFLQRRHVAKCHLRQIFSPRLCYVEKLQSCLHFGQFLTAHSWSGRWEIRSRREKLAFLSPETPSRFSWWIPKERAYIIPPMSTSWSFSCCCEWYQWFLSHSSLKPCLDYRPWICLVQIGLGLPPLPLDPTHHQVVIGRYQVPFKLPYA